MEEEARLILSQAVTSNEESSPGAAGLGPLGHQPGRGADQLGRHPGHQSLLNPARSTATAVFADGWALQQLLLFWVSPILRRDRRRGLSLHRRAAGQQPNDPRGQVGPLGGRA